jgi:flagellar protein FlbD
MIQLTRLNNTTLTINSDLIKCVEQSPDTVISLLSGEKILVRESAGQILDAIVAFRRRVLSGLNPWASAGAIPRVHELQDENEHDEDGRG